MKALDVRRNPSPHLLTLVVYPEWEAGALHFGLAPMFQWFSLGHKHKHGIFNSILDTSSPQPDNKQDGGRSVRHCCF